MIGNDVVDLHLAARESNWRRKGFLEKVFTTAEQEIISTSKDKDTTVWLLWSMKEAAYKAHQRAFNLPVKLNWLAQECKLLTFSLEHASGEVNVNGNLYFTTSKITSEFIHTSAEKDRSSGAENAIFEAPSSEAKAALIKRVSGYFSLEPAQLQLEKDAFGMPFLSLSKTSIFDRFSLSGHGRFSTYILSLINCETSVKQY
ncbi:4-phosphopantetheinyl transferase family protein [Salinimicrobium sp. CDJ15-81-2]|nr:4-phosphopantetheinyl transferase family protein [Salinimicrobium nanhaiense]